MHVHRSAIIMIKQTFHFIDRTYKVNWNITCKDSRDASPCSSFGFNRDTLCDASSIRTCSESAFRLTFSISPIICDNRSSACLDSEPSCLITPARLLTNAAPRSFRTASSSSCLPKYRGSICLWSSGMLGIPDKFYTATAPMAVYWVCATAVLQFHLYQIRQRATLSRRI